MKRVCLLVGVLFCLVLAIPGQAMAMPSDLSDPRDKAYAEAVNTYTVPDIVGIYEGYPFLIHEVTDIKDQSQFLGLKKQNFTITEQNMMMIRGQKTYFDMIEQKSLTEDFSGVITSDGKRILIAEKEDGFMEVDILGDGRLVAYYTEDGPEFKCITLILDKVN